MNPLVILHELVLPRQQAAIHLVQIGHELLVRVLDGILHLAEIIGGFDRVCCLGKVKRVRIKVIVGEFFYLPAA